MDLTWHRPARESEQADAIRWRTGSARFPRPQRDRCGPPQSLEPRTFPAARRTVRFAIAMQRALDAARAGSHSAVWVRMSTVRSTAGRREFVLQADRPTVRPPEGPRRQPTCTRCRQQGWRSPTVSFRATLPISIHRVAQDGVPISKSISNRHTTPLTSGDIGRLGGGDTAAPCPTLDTQRRHNHSER